MNMEYNHARARGYFESAPTRPGESPSALSTNMTSKQWPPDVDGSVKQTKRTHREREHEEFAE